MSGQGGPARCRNVAGGRLVVIIALSSSSSSTTSSSSLAGPAINLERHSGNQETKVRTCFRPRLKKPNLESTNTTATKTVQDEDSSNYEEPDWARKADIAEDEDNTCLIMESASPPRRLHFA